jgi:hypothetical protein
VSAVVPHSPKSPHEPKLAEEPVDIHRKDDPEVSANSWIVEPVFWISSTSGQFVPEKGQIRGLFADQRRYHWYFRL